MIKSLSRIILMGIATCISALCLIGCPGTNPTLDPIDGTDSGTEALEDSSLQAAAASLVLPPTGGVKPPHPAMKLPFANNSTWTVTRAYDYVTHKNHDAFALDFSQAGCLAYGLPILAVSDGQVVLADGASPSYGSQVLIYAGGYIFRYAHLSKINVQVGTNVLQGQKIGECGNTGQVAGQGCSSHPGTHLHFAMYYINGNILVAERPEPMSGFTDFLPGRSYISDNGVTAPSPQAEGCSSPFTNSTCLQISYDQLASLAYSNGNRFKGGALVTAIAVAAAESERYINAVGDKNYSGDCNNYPCADCYCSVGLWQINRCCHGQTQEYWFDPEHNASKAFDLSNASVDPDWGLWGAYTNGRFLSQDPLLATARAYASIDPVL